VAALIDSSVVIALERGKLSDETLTATAHEAVMLSAVTVSELLHGVYRADSARRLKREAFVEGILASATILPFDTRVARVHARLSVALAISGLTVGAHDLLIGSTAVAHGLPIVTANVRDFRRIPELDVIAV
jgi:tRNA(fMet)-specific endonuclease VapC